MDETQATDPHRTDWPHRQWATITWRSPDGETIGPMLSRWTGAYWKTENNTPVGVHLVTAVQPVRWVPETMQDDPASGNGGTPTLETTGELVGFSVMMTSGRGEARTLFRPVEPDADSARAAVVDLQTMAARYRTEAERPRYELVEIRRVSGK